MTLSKRLVGLVALTLLAASSALANVPLIGGLGGPRGYGTDCLSPNDDGSSASIDITSAFPAGLRFFTDTPHTRLFVNTNGNISFSGAVPTFTPNPFPVSSQPMIAAYWGDVDIRPLVDGNCRGIPEAAASSGSGACENPERNGAWWKLEPGRMTFTWDRVGYYACNLDKVMDFQMILTAAPEACGVAPGDFDVEFRYNTCEWTTGDASGGTNGFGGTGAQIGFDAGNNVDFVQIEGSRTNDIHTIACTQSNVGEPGRWVFQIRGGAVVCPDAGQPCDTGAPGICGAGRTSCVGAGTQCQAAVEPGVERCNAVDDDCDGEVDEGEGLCGDGSICQRGVCIVCGEIGCVDFDTACEGVVCEEGLFCREGNCVDACAGVVCPGNESCVAGRCVDACDSLACDDCSVCEGGLCVTKCTEGSCAAGESCQPDGRCVETACTTVTCDTGSTCVGGTCVDGCTGVVCPEGEGCFQGACVDATTIPGEGEGEGENPGEGEGENPGEGEGEVPGEGEGEGPRGGDDDDDDGGAGCACDATTMNDSVLVLGALGLLFVRRRRR
ncbi:MAG TPA: nidogen-like domain-containing protein [Myxococcota bacterium]